MRRRSLLLGVPLLAAARAQAQPMPLIGPVGRRRLGAGPLWSLNAGPPGKTLDLSFMTGTLDPSVTFTRASTATYYNSAGTNVTAATNAPRFDYNPSTLALNGLLIEEARTNVVATSVPDNTNWTVTASTLTANAATAPDGTTTAGLLLETTANSAHTFTAAGVFTYTSGTNYAFSVFAKAATGHFLQIFTAGAPFASSPYANFDLSAGTVGTSVGVGASIQNVGNGWFRCTMIAVASTSTSATQFVMGLQTSASATRSFGYVGTGIGVYIWGAQTEAGAFPTSYIPTTGAAVTRAADVATIASIPGRNTAAESFQAETLLYATQSNNNPRWIGDNSTARAPIQIHIPGGVVGGSFDGVATVQTVNTLTLGTVAKIASTWASPNTGRVCLNGGAVALLTTLTSGFSIMTTVKLMGDQTTTDTSNGWMRRFRYWPRVLTDAEMQQVTT